MTVNALVVIQARMNSSRLPGKVLRRILGKPLLLYLLERIQNANLISNIIVATTFNKEDDEIEREVTQAGIEVFRGSEEDVLGRFAACCKDRKEELIVRITADCPLIDPSLIDRCIALSKDLPSNSFITTSPHDQKDRTFPRGTDIEIFSKVALAEADREAISPDEREHVTVFFRKHPERYPYHVVNADKVLPELRLTVDEKIDLDLITTLIEALYPVNPLFTLDDIVSYLKQHPEVASINSGIMQKIPII